MDLIIFDFDGLILDTETVSYEAWSSIFKSHGVELPIQEWAKCVGTSYWAFDVHAYLEQQVGRSLDRAELTQRHRDLCLVALAPLQPRPGVLDYLQEARNLKIPIALASSSNQDWVMSHLSRFEIADWFHSIRTADDVEKVKPDPELYQLTLTTMGVKPHRALAFEDSPNGIKAAKAAGIYCVAVPNSVTRQMPLGEADRRIESMADIRLRDLLHEIAMSQK
jgi:HAD superfamily hydrolase (TIGR01509 family)